ncbi:MAG: hypothetical protein A2145_05760 [candidate division Zixibacteria bacterium RBG_16_40_9]|nr:MAG: hypothetical protein A2145_05760 [candidate division Zixibacteria bacterium RBG_16_40_9]
MRKIFWLIIILNFALLIPRFKANLPLLMRDLAGELRAGNLVGLEELLDSFAWLKRQKERGAIREDAVVVCSKPQFCYYYSGLRSSNFPFSENKNVVFSTIIQADLIIAENLGYLSQLYLNQVILDSSRYFRVLYRTEEKIPNLVIFAVKKEEVAKLRQRQP